MEGSEYAVLGQYLSAHLKLNNFDFVDYDWGFVALVEGSIEHLDCIEVKLVGKSRPVEGE